MIKLKFNDGEELVFDDLADLQHLAEKGLLEQVLYPLYNQADGFVAGGFLVSAAGGMALDVAAGRGYLYDSGEADADKSKYKPIVATAVWQVTVPTADATNPRKDILCVTPARVNASQVSRLFMNETTLAITTENLYKRDNESYTHQYVAGTPAGSPSEPAVPAGYTRIATIDVAAGATAINTGNITDRRTVLPYIQTPTPAGPSARVVSFSTAGGSKATMTTARSSFAYTVSGTNFYAIGGRLSNVASDSQNHNEAYNTGTNTWSSKTAMTTSRREVRGAMVANKIYVIGGWNNGLGGNIGYNEEYDTVGNTWATKTAHPAGSASQCPMIAYSGKVYVFSAARTDEYNPGTDTWASKAAPSVDHEKGAVGVVGTKAYIAGGMSNTCHEYDLAGNSWATKTVPSNTHQNTQGEVLGSSLYVVSGNNGGGLATNMDAYSPATNTWSAKSAVAVARRDAGVCVVGSVLYYFGGSDQGQATYYNNHDAYQDVAMETAASHGLVTARTSGTTLINTTSGLTGASIGISSGDNWGVNGANGWATATAEAIAIGGD